MRYKLLTLAVVAGFLIAAVPALAQDDTSPTTTPTVTTPTTPADTTETTDTAPSDDSDAAETGSSELAETGGGESWKLLAIGGILAVGSALLLVRRPRRNQ